MWGERDSGGLEEVTMIEPHYFSNNCTYCGGALEDNYPPSAIALGVLCFPCGVVACCMLKEKQCVKCNRSFA